MSILELPCRAILFDSDGVLVDSDAVVLRSWARWARAWGLEPDEVTAQVHGRRSEDTVALLVEPERRAHALADIDRYEVEDASDVTPIPGAVDLVRSMPAGAWAVVTSGIRRLATARLRAAGLPVPDVLVTADDVPAGKPDPTGYLSAAAALGQPPGECVVLEDSVAGVAAGLAAGATVVGVGERALHTRAGVVVRDLVGLSWNDAALHLPASRLLRG
jgi:mannitol-1-/sugar-/sorbitol-6-phosphatase